MAGRGEGRGTESAAASRCPLPAAFQRDGKGGGHGPGRRPRGGSGRNGRNGPGVPPQGRRGREKGSRADRRDRNRPRPRATRYGPPASPRASPLPPGDTGAAEAAREAGEWGHSLVLFGTEDGGQVLRHLPPPALPAGPPRRRRRVTATAPEAPR